MPWRVRIALAEKRVDCELAQVDVPAAQQLSPDFLKLNPFGQIPVLEDEGVVVSESIAILEYLEERFPEPALMPADAVSRALARQWMGWSNDYWPSAWK